MSETDYTELAGRLESLAEDDMLAIARDIHLGIDVDEMDLRRWASTNHQAAQAIRKLVEERDALIHDVGVLVPAANEEATEADRLRSLLDEALGALEPFASVADRAGMDRPRPLDGLVISGLYTSRPLTIGHMRRARSTISKIKGALS